MATPASGLVLPPRTVVVDVLVPVSVSVSVIVAMPVAMTVPGPSTLEVAARSRGRRRTRREPGRHTVGGRPARAHWSHAVVDWSIHCWTASVTPSRRVVRYSGAVLLMTVAPMLCGEG